MNWQWIVQLLILNSMEMLSQSEFYELPLNEKIKKLYFEGEFVVAIRYYKFKINLYLYNNFLVEVFYEHKFDRISKVVPFSSDKARMKFYADQIKLPVDFPV